MGNYLSALIILVPTVLICLYVYTKDKTEKEPISFLIFLFILGAVATVFATIIEIILRNKVTSYISNNFSVGDYGQVSALSYVKYLFMENYLCMGLVEELFKWLVMFIPYRSKSFNYTFDGVVYGVFVALGFSVVSNLMYAMVYGVHTAIIRCASIFVSMSCGVMMGIYFARAKRRMYSGKSQRKCSHCVFLAAALIFPWLINGTYQLSCTNNSWFFIAASCAVIYYIIMILCYTQIKNPERKIL